MGMLNKAGILLAACAGAAVLKASTVTNFTVHSACMKRDIPAAVILPAGYAAASAMRYPCVVVLHGAGGSALKKAADATLGKMVDRYGFIVACPDGGSTSWWLDSPIDPAYRYETFVIGEFLPFVDAHYRTIPTREKRGIMGGSMGGHGACYLGIRHRDLFGVIGNIYGGVDLVPWASNWDIALRLGPRDENMARWEAHSVVTLAKDLKNGEVDLISAIGTEDFFLGCNRQLHELLARNGVAHTYVEVRAETTLSSVHGRFYGRGAEICGRFIANYFKDGYGHLGDVDAR